MNPEEIINLAIKFKNYVEKNHKFPTKIVINDKTYTYGELGYYFTEFIKKPGKTIPSKKVKNNTKSQGVTLNEKVLEYDFKDQVKRISQFVLQTGTLPNYVTSVASKKKIRPRDYIYAFSKIVVYYATHNHFPAYCLYASNIYNVSSTSAPKKTIVSKKYGRSTKQGCDNRGQNTGYNCGPHMAQEIIRNLTGKVIPQSTIASVMGTTTSGTGHAGINTFFSWFNKKYGYNLKIEWKNFSEVGWNGIKKILESNNQDCGLHELYRDTWGHYTNFDKIYSSTVDVHNSLGDSCSKCYCGYTENRSKSVAERYLKGISQKSVLIVTNGGK